MNVDPAWYINVYLKSSYWRNVRRPRYWATHDKRCEACGTRHEPATWYRWRPNFIVLHHKSYDNLWKEPDSDLCALCSRCHRNVHAIDRRGKFGTLRRATDWYVERGQRKRRARRERASA